MRIIVVAALLQFTFSVPLLAQIPKRSTETSTLQVPSEPHSTSAAFGDWVLVCQRIEPITAKRMCELSQSVQIQGQPGPAMQLSISKSPPPARDMRLTVLLPTNVSLKTAPKVSAEEGDKRSVQLGWLRCLVGGCFADAALGDEVLNRWRTLTDRGLVSFDDAAGRPIVLPFSYRGLAQSLDALPKD